MGAYSNRQLRAAFNFVLRPLLLAVFLTVLARTLFGQSKHKLSKALVVASTSDQHPTETAWIKQVPREWKVFQYVADKPASKELAVPINKGNEAMVYLTYIIDHYDHLPDVVFFHHSHAQAWHQEMDSLTEVTKLRASYVAKKGFAAARCLRSCENIISLADHSVDFEMFPRVGREVQLSSLLDEFLDRSMGEKVPKKLAAPCCAQFAASRDAIRRHDLQWWQALRQWLTDTPLDSMNSGRLLEYTWHIWLGEEAYQ
jgi:hypothetical protein